MAQYTDTQRYDNYLILLKHIDMLKTLPLTEDRFEEYKWYFNIIKEYFTNISLVNAENQTKHFREAARSAELCMNLLKQEFDIKIYLQLLVTCKYLVEEVEGDNELDSLVDGIKIN